MPATTPPIFSWPGRLPRPKSAAIRQLADALGLGHEARVFIPKTPTVTVLFTLLAQERESWTIFDARFRNAAIRLAETYPTWVERQPNGDGIGYRLTTVGRDTAQRIKDTMIATDQGPLRPKKPQPLACNYIQPAPPTGTTAQHWANIAYEYAETPDEVDEFTWTFDPGFPAHLLFSPEELGAAWARFQDDNERRTAEWETEGRDVRPGEMFYDTYPGWWNAPDARSGEDCPIIVFSHEEYAYGKPGWRPWDGWHRSVIACYIGLKTFPAVVGIRKQGLPPFEQRRRAR